MNKDLVSFLEKIEEHLIDKNIHINIVKEVMNLLANKVISTKNITKDDIIKILFLYFKNIMINYTANFHITEENRPYVMLVCGVNGSGKTTTIGKMVKLLKSLDWSVVVAACDTYRPAAEEQLRIWIENDASEFVFREYENETTYKIALKALKIAEKQNKDVVIIDTAGRLQNNQNLMAELLKMKQKLKEHSHMAPHDVVLIIDANCGYNAIQQAKMYNELIGITGIIATKIDISKSAGAILSICKMFNIPIYGITNGEGENDIDDLDPDKFTKSLLSGLETI